MNDEIHKALTPLEVYDVLRSAHSLVKDCLYAKNFEQMSSDLQNAIESVSGVLYLAEGVAVKEDNSN